MKTIDMEKSCTKVAKDIVARIKAKMQSGKPVFSVGIRKCFAVESEHNGKEYVEHLYYRPDEKVSIELPYGETSSFFETLTSNIYDKVMKKIRVPKKTVAIRRTYEETSGSWYSSRVYSVTKGILFITPCKEFNDINKKLKALGLKPVGITDWVRCEVFGKRSTYDVTSTHYYAVDKSACEKVLSWLKGKKKCSYELKYIENMEDREYGERYETEWGGSFCYKFKFKDANGKTTLIY